jgi:transketolase
MTNIAELPREALEIRKKFLKMHFKAQSAHIGSGLSVIELLVYIYRMWLSEADKFILSKGHAASALYATLNHVGILADEDLETYYQDGTLLAAHPVPNAHLAISAATGSLGHGLPIATGMAFAAKHLQASNRRVACMVSDGECNEGTTWESALFASHHQLNNLFIIVDANGLQGFGRTSEVLELEPFADKWRAFGFNVHDIDGHHFEQIHAAFIKQDTRPTCVIARTVKGKGVASLENTLACHYSPINDADHQKAQEEFDRGVHRAS